MGTQVVAGTGVAPAASPANGSSGPVGQGPRLAEELAKVEDEPFLPVERRLVGWSLALGILLLGILVWVSRTFFAG